MRSVSVREMRTALPRLEQLLEEEGEIVVTRHGRPVARVLPTVREGGIPSRAELRRRMRRLEVGSEVLIREDRDARG
jgi:antitoxin (DNA-binding transcriptional repressor) of toxin-antitoxin stability system